MKNVYDNTYPQVQALKELFTTLLPDCDIKKLYEWDIEDYDGMRTSIFNYLGRDVAIVTILQMPEEDKYGIIIKLIE